MYSGLAMPVSRSNRKHWRLPGLPAGWLVVRRQDVEDGEEPAAVPQAVLDRLLEPLESTTYHQAIEICESIHPGAIRPFRNWSVRERQTWVRRTLSEAFSGGAVTMVRELPDNPPQPLLIGRTLGVGPHAAWLVANLNLDSWSSRGGARTRRPGKRRDVPGAMLLMRRQDVQSGDRVVSSPEDAHSIADSLFRPECEVARLEILQALRMRPGRLNRVTMRRGLERALETGWLALVWREERGS